MRFFNYIKKYSDFYLSKYSVTKRKFEDILKQKLKKDFFKKKISTEEYDTFVKQIDGVVDYYNEIGLFNEELIIKMVRILSVSLLLILLSLQSQIAQGSQHKCSHHYRLNL